MGKESGWPLQCTLQVSPIKSRAWIEFAPGRNVFVARHMPDGVACGDVLAKRSQPVVLRGLEVETFQAFEFDADGIIVAVAATPVGGRPCVPCALVAIHKLPQRTGAVDKKMAGHLESTNALVVRVSIPVQCIGKELLHGPVAIFAGGQTDGMHHDQVHGVA